MTSLRVRSLALAFRMASAFNPGYDIYNTVITFFAGKMSEPEQVGCSSSESDNFEKIDSDEVRTDENVSKFV